MMDELQYVSVFARQQSESSILPLPPDLPFSEFMFIVRYIPPFSDF